MSLKMYTLVGGLTTANTRDLTYILFLNNIFSIIVVLYFDCAISLLENYCSIIIVLSSIYANKFSWLPLLSPLIFKKCEFYF